MVEWTRAGSLPALLGRRPFPACPSRGNLCWPLSWARAGQGGPHVTRPALQSRGSPVPRACFYLQLVDLTLSSRLSLSLLLAFSPRAPSPKHLPLLFFRRYMISAERAVRGDAMRSPRESVTKCPLIHFSKRDNHFIKLNLTEMSGDYTIRYSA